MANAHSSLVSLFTDIANAIRAKTGGAGEIIADSFPAAIAGIQSGTDTSDATAASADVKAGKTFYAGGEKKTGSAQSVERGTPSISVDAGTGHITASCSQAGGIVEAGTTSTSYQMATQGAQSILPSVSYKYIPAGTFLTGMQTIQGDINLQPGNIKAGISIFGVTGSYAAHAAGGSFTGNGSGSVTLPFEMSEPPTHVAVICEGSYTGMGLNVWGALYIAHDAGTTFALFTKTDQVGETTFDTNSRRASLTLASDGVTMALNNSRVFAIDKTYLWAAW